MRSSRSEVEKRKVGRPTKGTTVADESPPKSPKGSSVPKSPDRGRQTSRYSTRSSPSRKSPNRKSPSRKSPARKSPARKSPSRATKDLSDTDVQKTPTKRPSIKSDIHADYVVSSTTFKVDPSGKTKRPYDFPVKELSIDLREQPRITLIDNQNGLGTTGARVGLRERRPRTTEDILPTRRSTRLQEAFETVNDILSMPQPNITKPLKDIFSAEELSEEEELSLPGRKIKQNRSLSTPLDDANSKFKKDQLMQDFGGNIGAVFTIPFSVLLLFGLNIFCDKSQCTVAKLPNFGPYLHLHTWFSLRAAGIWLLYVTLLVISSVIPLGKKISIPDSDLVFRKNCYLCFVSLILATVTAKYFGIEAYQIVYDEYFRLMVIATIASFIFATIFFVKSRNVPDSRRNPYGNTGSVVYDFVAGRECLLSVGGIHVKNILRRILITSAIYLDVSYLILGTTVGKPIPSTLDAGALTTFFSGIHINPALLTFTLTHIIYLLYFITFEEKTHTFEQSEEGVGFITCFAYNTYPFLMIVPKYILEHKVHLSPIILGLVWATFLLGLYISFISNRIKHIFRTNHLDSRVSRMETMPTFQGKRLLLSGWWGFVRHPNYLGDILVHLAWCLTWPACVWPALTILLLILRVKRVEARCERRYEAAWRRYVAKVQYAILPKVY